MIPLSYWKLDYKFVNAQAKTYWNALCAANGGVEINGGIYGISNRQLKQAIDNLFITLSTDVNITIVSLLRLSLKVGGTAATNAINAVNPGTFNGTFVNSPTQSKEGTDYTGTQYENWNIKPTNANLNQVAYGIYIKNNVTGGGTVNFMGAQESGSVNVFKLRYNSITFNMDGFINQNTSTSLLGTGGNTSGYWTVARRSSTNLKLYRNGVSQAVDITGAGARSDDNIVSGGLNNNGAVTANNTGILRMEYITNESMTDATALAYYNAFVAFDTALNR